MGRFTKPKDGTSNRLGPFNKQGGKKNAFKNRKERRKEERKAKKAKRHSYYMNKAESKNEKRGGLKMSPKKSMEERKPLFKDNRNIGNARREQMNVQVLRHRKGTVEINNSGKEEGKKKVRKRKKLTSGDVRKLQLKEANREEDKAIKRLEKQLKLNKRRKKDTLPKSFVEEGLGYVLEVLDRPEALKGEGHLSDADSELSDDIAKAIRKDVNSDDQSDQSDQSNAGGVDSFFETGKPSQNLEDGNDIRSILARDAKERQHSERKNRVVTEFSRKEDDLNWNYVEELNQGSEALEEDYGRSEVDKMESRALKMENRSENQVKAKKSELCSDSDGSEIGEFAVLKKDSCTLSKKSNSYKEKQKRAEIEDLETLWDDSKPDEVDAKKSVKSKTVFSDAVQAESEDEEFYSDSSNSEVDISPKKKQSFTFSKKKCANQRKTDESETFSEGSEVDYVTSSNKNASFSKVEKNYKTAHYTESCDSENEQSEEVENSEDEESDGREQSDMLDSTGRFQQMAENLKKNRDVGIGSVNSKRPRKLEESSEKQTPKNISTKNNRSGDDLSSDDILKIAKSYEAANPSESSVSGSESQELGPKDEVGSSEEQSDESDSDQSQPKLKILQNRNTNSEKMLSGDKKTPTNGSTKTKRSGNDLDSDEVIAKRTRKNSDVSVASEEEGGELWEDIYGRLRDQKGNVVASGKGGVGGKYVPPGKREEEGDDKKTFQLQRLKRQLKGLLNRLSEANVQSIANQIENLYMHHSRSDMNHTLMLLVLESVVSRSPSPERLVMEHALLVALLHANIGTEIGAYFLQSLVTKLDGFLRIGGNYGEGKECDNLLLLILHFYTFKMTENVLIFDIMKRFIDQFQEKDIELILLMLRSVGFQLRKDNPLKLKEMIVSLQSKATTSQHDQTRIRFMLETMMAIRNNNMHKIPNYDPSLAEHLRKVLRGFIRKGCYVQELFISLDDLLNSEERGRWWIVGSAWSGKTDQQEQEDNKMSAQLSTSNVSEKILGLASKQRMNTDIRKTIFCLIVTAEDYMDAFEKVLHLNLKNQQEREIIHVSLDCCLQEKRFNRFYALLMQKLCQFDRRFQMTLQFSLWDKFKELENLQSWQVTNMAHLLVQLLTNDALPLSVLKAIHLSEMDRPLVKFLRQVLLGVLLHESEEVCRKVFGRIAVAPKLQILREGLRLFMRHFLLRNRDKMDPDVADKLASRVEVADAALLSAEKKLRL